jgi:hypothetical protein
MKCPLCGQEAKQTQTRFGIRNDCCDLHSWGDAPLVDPETHALRISAHDAFDPLWRSDKLSRTAAYKLLAQELGIGHRKCHMKTLDKDLLRQVPLAVARIKEYLA